MAEGGESNDEVANARNDKTRKEDMSVARSQQVDRGRVKKRRSWGLWLVIFWTLLIVIVTVVAIHVFVRPILPNPVSSLVERVGVKIAKARGELSDTPAVTQAVQPPAVADGRQSSGSDPDQYRTPEKQAPGPELVLSDQQASNEIIQGSNSQASDSSQVPDSKKPDFQPMTSPPLQKPLTEETAVAPHSSPSALSQPKQDDERIFAMLAEMANQNKAAQQKIRQLQNIVAELQSKDRKDALNDAAPYRYMLLIAIDRKLQNGAALGKLYDKAQALWGDSKSDEIDPLRKMSAYSIDLFSAINALETLRAEGPTEVRAGSDGSDKPGLRDRLRRLVRIRTPSTAREQQKRDSLIEAAINSLKINNCSQALKALLELTPEDRKAIKPVIADLQLLDDARRAVTTLMMQNLQDSAQQGDS